MNREIKIGGFYHHFKSPLDEVYKVLSIATHTETNEELVIYQRQFGDYKIFARPKEMFLSEVDRDKYPESKQLYRFEEVGDDLELKKRNLNEMFDVVYSYNEENYKITEYKSEFYQVFIITDSIIPIESNSCINISGGNFTIIVKIYKDTSRSFIKLYYNEEKLNDIYDTIKYQITQIKSKLSME